LPRSLKKLFTALYYLPRSRVAPGPPSRRQPFSFLGETSKFKTELGFGAFQSPEVKRPGKKKKKLKIHNIFIFGFQCIAKSIEG
jgi:hypothetical protein